jgi:hypothetical protein
VTYKLGPAVGRGWLLGTAVACRWCLISTLTGPQHSHFRIQYKWGRAGAPPYYVGCRGVEEDVEEHQDTNANIACVYFR